MSESSAVGISPADPRTNSAVKFVLRSGLSLALVAMVVGLLLQLAIGRHRAVSVKMFGLFAPHSVGETLMSVGALIVTMTPVLGVLTVVANWVRERDHRFALVGAVVASVLALAVVIGLVG